MILFSYPALLRPLLPQKCLDASPRLPAASDPLSLAQIAPDVNLAAELQFYCRILAFSLTKRSVTVD